MKERSERMEAGGPDIADSKDRDGGKGSVLLQGAALLGLAAVISKLIGTLQKIPLQNLAGDAVFGIYNAVYPLYILILVLATAGFPLVVSKFVSEYAAERQYDEARRVLRVASLSLMGTGIVFFLLLYFGAETIARWMAAPQTAPAIRSVSYALLVVPLMSALRGYYQGYQDMRPTAWSQVVEQMVRVATMVVLLLVLMRLGFGPERIAAGATFGSVMGALAGLAVMLWYWRKERRRELFRAQASVGGGGGWRRDWALAKRLSAYALPLCLGSVAMPILTLVDSFTMPRLLRSAGFDESEALYQFGLYNHGLPLVQLVAMIASSMSAALVPAIAEALRRGDADAVRARAGLSLRLTWLIGLAASFGLALLAEPLNVMFFKSAEGTAAMAVLAFTALFSAVNIVAGSVLQGLGAVRAPVLYLLLAAAVKVAASVALVPRYGIDGAAWASLAAYALAGGLALAHALRAAGVPAAGGLAAMKPMLGIGFMALGLLAVTHGVPPLLAQLPAALPPRGTAAVIALGGVAVGALAYAVALLRLGVVTAADLALVPQLAGKPLAWLRRFRLLR
ncbi:polysaccharide biosynthesis protein [Paenibacillus sp. A3]|uniref:putative polysaccharide biosynthesis protein n=1 Tax=Paenibacillus sp. A3 TaxID=1337054 RepID=UPI0006D5AA44|nr:polysaccharide biosynthesis protein [Paenibacillus sp. A3]